MLLAKIITLESDNCANLLSLEFHCRSAKFILQRNDIVIRWPHSKPNKDGS